jgi:DNA-directed RNA polymerase II subunit RPB7
MPNNFSFFIIFISSSGPNLRETLIEKLYAEVEGTCSGRYGFIVTVAGIESVSVGKIMDGTGAAQYTISFKGTFFFFSMLHHC